MPNVPYDNYLALLHKGERVLTAKENKEYKKEDTKEPTTIIKNENLNVTIKEFNNNRKQDVREFAEETAIYQRQFKQAKGEV